MASRQFEIVVAGGGAAGWMTAGLAAAAGREVLLIDPGTEAAPAPADTPDLRVIALAPGSRALFESLGAWPDELSARAGPYRRMEVWDATGSGEIAFDAGDVGLPELGHIVELPILQWALEQALAARFAVLRGAAVVGFEPVSGGLRVSLDDGQTRDCRLLVGADGADSLIRRRAAIAVEQRDYRQQGVVANFAPQIAHGEVARQAFTTRGSLGLLPLAGGELSIVWSVAPTEARRLLALEDAALGAEVAAAAGDRYGRLRALGPRAAFDLRLMHAGRYQAPRIALVGDAAHVVHPLAGLGLNLGFADARALIDALDDDAGGPGGLRRYSRQRRAEVLPAIGLIDGLDHLFRAPQAPLGRLRGLGLGAVDRATPIKRAFMRYAVGAA